MKKKNFQSEPEFFWLDQCGFLIRSKFFLFWDEMSVRAENQNSKTRRILKNKTFFDLKKIGFFICTLFFHP